MSEQKQSKFGSLPILLDCQTYSIS